LDEGFTKIATGHNLDDVAETLFTLYMHGEVTQIVRLSLINKKSHPKLVAKVKPLWFITERENLVYALLKGLPIREGACPLSMGARSLKTKTIINSIEKHLPGFKHRLVSSHLEKILPALQKSASSTSIIECSSCGMPSTQSPCAFCKRIWMVRKLRENTSSETIDVD
jgi:uncharacterized protein (TIGR00269 family)